MPQNETHMRVVVLVAVGGTYLTIKLGNDLTVMISHNDLFITEKIEVCMFFGVSRNLYVVDDEEEGSKLPDANESLDMFWSRY